MNKMEEVRKKVELAKLAAAKMELEFKIMQMEEDIQRVREHIRLNEAKQAELVEELKAG